MTKRDEKEQHEADADETLWERLKRRWRKFCKDMGATLTIVGVLAFLSFLGGAAYYYFGDCEWPMINRQECVKSGPNEEVAETEISLPPIQYTGVMEGDCDAEARNRLARQETPADCENVFFATSRAIQDGVLSENFGSRLEFGKSTVLVPFVVLDNLPPKFCERYSLLGKNIEVQNPLCFKDENGQIFNKNDFDYISRKDYIDRRRAIRKDDSSQSKWIGLARLGWREQNYENLPASAKIAKEKFAAELDAALPDHDGAIFLYVHGFDTELESAVETVAHLSKDLDFRRGLVRAGNANDTIPSVGVPLVYAWPTLLLPKSSPLLEIPDRGLISYVESQLRSEVSKKKFTELIVDVISQTKARKLNILAHSMGNRAILEAIPLLRKGVFNKNGQRIEINIVHTAADVSVVEFERKTNQASNPTSFRSAIYFSETDKALLASRTSQTLKIIYEAILSSDNHTFDQEYAELRAKLEKLPWLTDALVGDLMRDLSSRWPTMRSLASSADLNVEDFFSESSCRLGGSWVFVCKPYVSAVPGYETVSATDFQPSFWDVGHSYFSQSPTVIADTACFFQGDDASSPYRGLKKKSYRDGFLGLFGKRHVFWRLSAGGAQSENCTLSGAKYVVRRKKALPLPPPAIERRIIEVWFPLMKASPAYLVPVPATSVVSEYDDAQFEFQNVLSDIGIKNIVGVDIKACADTSGAEDYNKSLSARRASFLKAMMIQLGVSEHIIISNGLGECPAVQTPGRRNANLRKATIILVYKTN